MLLEEITKAHAAETRPTAYINARLIDPATGLDEQGGVLVADGKIADVGRHIHGEIGGDTALIDCGGAVLAPGLIDMMVFTGEPGAEHRGTLADASRAAAAGGVTTIICMPDTDPVIDDVALVDYLLRRARDTAEVNVHPLAAMTKALAGEEMTEIGLMQAAGAIAVTNGKLSLANARIMRNVLAYAHDFDMLVIHALEEPTLSSGGVMNSGEVSLRLGLKGIPAAAETIMLERDLRLVEMTGARYHAAEISCRASLEIIRRAKEKGLPVTCGVSINHLSLNENDIGPYRTFFKMRPPLRTEDDRQAMAEGLASGDIDVVVSAHDPQDADVKRHPFPEAADGAIGLETMLPVALRLYHNGDIPLASLLRPLTSNPAGILGLESGKLAIGAPADLVIFDPAVPWVVDAETLHSKSKNTPFDEARLEGRPLLTLVAGRIVYRYAEDRNS
ncbi:dihydroorotase [Methyloligella sp. 2.7D]|uniref:dihydroorotase n=1 Tax=unclassified Methyloligella TaxID=2625955 RepID=UPI00157BE1C2|nr:dihydroorotase [Methyloligella sp. GL2]QKP77427.1 dihydroorotase [Methyloligella sp. GL2]